MKKISLIAILTSLCIVPAFAGDIMNGQGIYIRYCMVCHGIDGHGDGPMAPAMMIKPNDLTRLSSEYDGVFPLELAIKRIDGREGLISHGSPMPVYGDFFGDDTVMLKTDAGQSVMTSQPIDDLVSWIISIQE